MSNYKTPADLGIEAAKMDAHAHAHVMKINNEFHRFVKEMIDDGFDQYFENSYSFLRDCLSKFQEINENMNVE